MNHFDRYLCRTLAASTLIALIFLLCVDFLLQSAEQSSNIGKGQYTVGVMILTLIYQIPEKLLLFAPAATLIGGIMGLGQLASQNEITIALASGTSRFRIVRGGLILAALIGVSLVALDQKIIPQFSAKSDLLRNQALGRSTSLTANEGLWLHESNSMTRIGQINDDGSISNLLRITPNHDNSTISSADKAIYKNGIWTLENSRKIAVNRNTVAPLEAETTWHSNVTPADVAALFRQDNYPSLTARFKQIQFLKANGLNYREGALKLWQKILLPLTIVTMILLALPFAFTRGRSAHQGTRLVTGILIGVAFYVSQGILANLALIIGWPPFLGAIAPIALFALPTWWFLR